MRWTDVEAGVWTVPKVPREKDIGGALRFLSSRWPSLRGNPVWRRRHVFPPAARGVRSAVFGADKAAFDANLPADTPKWTVHDLRRTARRSLMSRAGVRPDIAERVLGHGIGGVEASMTGTPISTRRPTRWRGWRR